MREPGDLEELLEKQGPQGLMLEAKMKLSERSEFFISVSAFNQILRPLFFLQFRNGSRFPHPPPPSCAIWQAPDISQRMPPSTNPNFFLAIPALNC